MAHQDAPAVAAGWSGEWLAHAQAAGGVGVFEWDAATGIARCTPEYFRVQGHDPTPDGTVTFPEWLTWVHADDRERALDEVRTAVRRGVPADWEYRVVAADGTVRWVHLRGRVERSSDGTPARMLGTLQDVTERRRLEDARRASEVRLRLALDAAKAGTFDIPRDRMPRRR